jgi:hypothetical protein
MRLLVIMASLLVACGGEISGADGGNSSDASTNQGDVCVDLETTSFDTSCNADTDCIGIYAGTLCSGYNCICPTATINASSEPAYGAMRAKVPSGKSVCTCPLFGTPHCIMSECVFCPNPGLKPMSLPPGCPDGGP